MKYVNLGLRIRTRNEGRDHFRDKKGTKTWKVLQMRRHLQDLKRFSCVFNRSVIPSSSGDTNYDIVLSGVFNEIRIGTREIAVSGSDISNVVS